MVRCVFFGTPEVAALTLKTLIDQNIDVVGVVTQSDKPKGRGGKTQPSPVKLTANTLIPNVPVLQPSKASDPNFIEAVRALKPDLLVVVAYGQILKPALLSIPKYAAINLHFSLLPKYRGAAPFQRAILNGDHETGVCILHMAEELDAGDIICSRPLPIDDEINAGELENKLGHLGANLLSEVIIKFEKGPVPGTPQNREQATYAPKLHPEDTQIDWTSPAPQIHNLIRAATPRPGAWTPVLHNGKLKRLRLLKSRVRQDLQGAPGEILTYGKQGLVLGCGTKALEILQLQMEGKKPLDAVSFCLGTPQKSLSFGESLA